MSAARLPQAGHHDDVAADVAAVIPVGTSGVGTSAADLSRTAQDAVATFGRLPLAVRDDIATVADATLMLMRAGRKARVVPIVMILAWPLFAGWIFRHLRLAQRLLARKDVSDALALIPETPLDQSWDPNAADAVVDDVQRLLLVRHAPVVCGYGLGLPPVVGIGFGLALYFV